MRRDEGIIDTRPHTNYTARAICIYRRACTGAERGSYTAERGSYTADSTRDSTRDSSRRQHAIDTILCIDVQTTGL